MNNKPSKVLIVSLDGATWDVLQPLIDSGDMPNLASLQREGLTARLKSTYPPLTPPAWTTFQTGVEPPQHGIFAFTEVSKDDWRSLRVVSGTLIRCKTLWQYLGEQDKCIVLVDVPLSYPFAEFKGAAVSDVFIPYSSSDAVGWTKPSDLGSDIDKLVGGWRFIKGPELRGASDKESLREFICLMKEFVHQRELVACHLLEMYEWDVAMIHLHAVDVVQHATWGFIDPSHPFYDPTMNGEVRNFYRRVDEAIGRISAFRTDETTFMIVSDHGFRSHRKVLNLNAWLFQHRYLKIPWKLALSRSASHNVIMSRGARLLHRLGVKRARFFYSYSPRYILDAERSSAISVAGPWQTQIGMINLNGAMSGTEKEILMGELAEELLALQDPDTGDRIVAEVRTGAEIYRQPVPGLSPDLIVLPAQNYSIDPGLPDDPVLKSVTRASTHIGTHAMNGILLMAGGTVSPGTDMDANILNMAPTIAWCAGEAVPSYMQGEPMTYLFDAGFVGKNPVKSIEDAGEPTRIETAFDDAEQEIVAQRLRDLGYL